jgi:hypothetical protein
MTIGYIKLPTKCDNPKGEPEEFLLNAMLHNHESVPNAMIHNCERLHEKYGVWFL